MSVIDVAIRYCPKANINLKSDDMHADEKLGSQWKFAHITKTKFELVTHVTNGT